MDTALSLVFQALLVDQQFTAKLYPNVINPSEVNFLNDQSATALHQKQNVSHFCPSVFVARRRAFRERRSRLSGVFYAARQSQFGRRDAEISHSLIRGIQSKLMGKLYLKG